MYRIINNMEKKNTYTAGPLYLILYLISGWSIIFPNHSLDTTRLRDVNPFTQLLQRVLMTNVSFEFIPNMFSFGTVNGCIFVIHCQGTKSKQNNTHPNISIFFINPIFLISIIPLLYPSPLALLTLAFLLYITNIYTVSYLHVDIHNDFHSPCFHSLLEEACKMGCSTCTFKVIRSK